MAIIDTILEKVQYKSNPSEVVRNIRETLVEMEGSLPTTQPSRYKALLTQTYTEIFPIPGVFEIGNTYLINTILNGDDFTNIGFVTPGVPFVATGTTATAWSSSGEVSNTVVIDATASAPVATVLENTLGGTPIWSYDSVGYYLLTLVGAFAGSGVTVKIGSEGGTEFKAVSFAGSNTDDIINVFTSLYTNLGGGDNGLLLNTSITIEVYP